LCSLLSPTHFLLPILGAQFPLEAAIGVNGRVWISSVEKEKPNAGSGTATRNSVKQTIAAIRCIQAFDEADLDSKGILALLTTFDL
jgi:exosome complex component RRP40